MLRKTEHTWAQKAPLYGENNVEISNDPRIIQTVETLSDSGQVSKKTFSYDNFNNVTDVYEYAYGSGAPGALLRRTHTDYLTTNTINGVNYIDNTIASSPHLRSLPVQTSIYDAGGIEQARIGFEYDNYATDTNHAPLVDRPGIIGFDASFTTSYLSSTTTSWTNS